MPFFRLGLIRRICIICKTITRQQNPGSDSIQLGGFLQSPEKNTIIANGTLGWRVIRLSGFSLPHRGHGVRVGAGECDELQLPAARRPPFGNSEGITRRSGAVFFWNPDSRSPARVRGLPHRLGQGRRLVCLIT